MKREFLEGLGLEKEAIDKIMAENGKDIEAGKAKLEEEQRLRQTAEQAVKERDKQIADLSKVDAAGLQAEVERLKTENTAAKETYEKQIAAIRMDTALDAAILAEKGRNTTAIKSLIRNRDQLKLKDDGSIDGLDLSAVKTSAPYLFDQVETRPEGNAPAGGSGSGGKNPRRNELRRIQGVAGKKLKRKDEQTYGKHIFDS